MKVTGIKLVHGRVYGEIAQFIRDDPEYFPHVSKLRSDGERLFVLDDAGQVNYSREMKSIREISHAEMMWT